MKKKQHRANRFSLHAVYDLTEFINAREVPDSRATFEVWDNVKNRRVKIGKAGYLRETALLRMAELEVMAGR